MPFNYAKVSSESSSNDDSLEQQQTYPGHDQRGRCTNMLDRIAFLRWPFTVLLLLVILVCELSILHRQPKTLEIGGELNGLIPTFSQEKKVFRTDNRYTSDHKTKESMNATRHAWHDLMPRGAGFHNVPDFASYDLPPPMHFDYAPGKESYAIAVFHELHCLYHMTAFVDELVMKIRNKDWTVNEGALGHNDHCFNYLRNAVMCAADTTLEGQSQEPMFKDVAGTDGTGATHICRNYDEVYAWADKYRLTDEKLAV